MPSIVLISFSVLVSPAVWASAYDALTVVGELALPDEPFQHGGLCLLGLEEQWLARRSNQ